MNENEGLTPEQLEGLKQHEEARKEIVSRVQRKWQERSRKGQIEKDNSFEEWVKKDLTKKKK